MSIGGASDWQATLNRSLVTCCFTALTPYVDSDFRCHTKLMSNCIVHNVTLQLHCNALYGEQAPRFIIKTVFPGVCAMTAILETENEGEGTLKWRNNDRAGVSNHQPRDCLLNRLFRRRSKKTSKLRVTGLCAGNSPVTGEFPAQRASNAKMFPFDDIIM